MRGVGDVHFGGPSLTRDFILNIAVLIGGKIVRQGRNWNRLFDGDVNFDVFVDERNDADDDAGPEGDFQDADAVGDFFVAPFGQPAVDFVQLSVDATFDFVQFLVEKLVGGFFQAAGDSADQAGFFDVFF